MTISADLVNASVEVVDDGSGAPAVTNGDGGGTGSLGSPSGPECCAGASMPGRGPAEASAARDGSGERDMIRILIAEDQGMVRAGGDLALSRFRWWPRSPRDEVVAAASKDRPDVALLDESMQRDGLEGSLDSACRFQ